MFFCSSECILNLCMSDKEQVQIQNVTGQSQQNQTGSNGLKRFQKSLANTFQLYRSTHLSKEPLVETVEYRISYTKEWNQIFRCKAQFNHIYLNCRRR